MEQLERVNSAMSNLATDNDRDVAAEARAVNDLFKRTPVSLHHPAYSCCPVFFTFLRIEHYAQCACVCGHAYVGIHSLHVHVHIHMHIVIAGMHTLALLPVSVKYSTLS